MKLYVGEVSLRLEGLPLEACGAYLKLILLTWDRGPIRKTTAEAILQRPLEEFGEAFMDLLCIDENMVTVDAVEEEKGFRIGKSKQAASAANARWTKEKMRPHSEPHSGRSTSRNAIKKKKENKEVEVEVDSGPFVFVWPKWAGEQTLAKWEEFKTYRWDDHKEKYKHEKSEQRAINLLAKYFKTGKECFEAMDEAMGRGWLFPLDPSKNKFERKPVDDE